AAGPGLVYDLENDGRYQVLASIKNEHGDGTTHLVVFDARTGKWLAELPDAEVLAVDDLDGDGRPEVVLRRGKELHIAKWKANDLQSAWHDTDVAPVLRPLPTEGDIRLAVPGGAPSRGNVALWRERAGSTSFLLRFTDGVRACRLGPRGLEKGRTVMEHEALGNLPTTKKSSEKLVWDGAKLVTLVDGREVFRYVPPAPVTYLAPPPLVADLGGRRRILVRDAAGSYVLVSGSGQKEAVMLERPYETTHIPVDPAGAGPMVCDMDGDGDNDLVATVTDAQGRPACVIFDGHGKVKCRFDLLPGMTALSRGPSGRLGRGQGRWLILR